MCFDRDINYISISLGWSPKYNFKMLDIFVYFLLFIFVLLLLKNSHMANHLAMASSEALSHSVRFFGTPEPQCPQPSHFV